MNANPIDSKIHERKALDFFEAMRDLRVLAEPGREYRMAIVLLAIHGTIALNDAVTIALKGKAAKYKSHSQAIGNLKQMCSSFKVKSAKGIGYFDALLALKTPTAYKTDQVSPDSAFAKAEAFYAWAYESFGSVLRGI